jgi:ribosomal protein S18 acetylase RimI-like enzyme
MINGEILDRGEYLAVRSPSEPTFYWGNLLVFAKPPQDGDLRRWEALFATEFKDLPEVGHRTFVWDKTDSPGVVEEFAGAGYRVEHSVVLTAQDLVLPKHPNSEVQIRTLESERDWQDLLDLKVVCRDEGHEENHFRGYAAGRLRGYRKRIDAGSGEWYSAFVGEQQVASLGMFRSDGSGRFQVVITHPAFRRRGICGTLVHHVARQTLDRSDIDSLVMLADTEYHAARIYESLGFSASESLTGLCRWPA